MYRPYIIILDEPEVYQSGGLNMQTGFFQEILIALSIAGEYTRKVGFSFKEISRMDA